MPEYFELGPLRIIHLGHASFQVEDAAGGTVLIDPFYADSFPWRDHIEKRLTPARARPEDVQRCDAIFVSHDHGDHWDPDAVASIIERTGAVLCAPQSVIRDAIKHGVEDIRTFAVQAGDWFDTGGEEDLRVGIIPDETCSDGAAPEKVSFLLAARNTTVFYSGDCHTVPPDLRPLAGEVDAAIVWYKPELVDTLVTEIRPRTVILMHYDHFKPGDLISGGDPEQMRQDLLADHPALTVLHSGPARRA